MRMEWPGRIIATAVAVTLAVVAAVAADVPRNLRKQFDGRVVTPVEGVWAWTNGALVVITADSSGRLTLVLAESPDPLIDTPMEIGTGHITGTPGTYELSLKTFESGRKRFPGTSRERFKATVTTGDSGTRLELSPLKTGLKVRLGRLLPYLLPVSVSVQSAPDAIEGAIRVYPDYGSTEMPVVL